MNLRDLKYLVAVADLQSFSGAAERCFVSQPTLSMQIKKLEDELGVAVFERNNRTFRITATGEAIIASARRILAEIGLIESIAAANRDPFAGTFRLGAFPTLASYLFPKVIPPLRAHFPALKLLLIEEKTDRLLEQVHNGQCDAAFLALPVNDASTVSIKLFEDPFVLAVPAHHPLAAERDIDPSLLSSLELLLLDEGHCLRDQALAICFRHGGAEEADFRATSMETLRMMVKAGSGLTLMPKLAIGEDDRGIRYIPFTQPSPKRTIGLVWRKTSPRTRLLDRLCDMLQNEVFAADG